MRITYLLLWPLATTIFRKIISTFSPPWRYGLVRVPRIYWRHNRLKIENALPCRKPPTAKQKPSGHFSCDSVDILVRAHSALCTPCNDISPIVYFLFDYTSNDIVKVRFHDFYFQVHLRHGHYITESILNHCENCVILLLTNLPHTMANPGLNFSSSGTTDYSTSRSFLHGGSSSVALKTSFKTLPAEIRFLLQPLPLLSAQSGAYNQLQNEQDP